jgi:hypothetical protein
MLSSYASSHTCVITVIVVRASNHELAASTDFLAEFGRGSRGNPRDIYRDIGEDAGSAAGIFLNSEEESVAHKSP